MNKPYNPAQEGIDAARQDAKNKKEAAFRTPPTAQELADAAATLSKLADFYEPWDSEMGQILVVVKILDNACCDLITDEES